MLLFDLQQFFLDWTYIAVFSVLFLCGLGLPIPEEVTLTLAGYLAHRGLVNPYLVMAVCSGAILAGDLMPYLAGRVWGERLLVRAVARGWVTRYRLRRFNRLFLRWRAWTIFFARFFPGLRSIAYYVAGTLHMPAWRFLFFDFLGVLITVPVCILIGQYFGEDIDSAIDTLHRYEGRALLAIGAGVLIVCGTYWWRRHRRRVEERKLPPLEAPTAKPRQGGPEQA